MNFLDIIITARQTKWLKMESKFLIICSLDFESFWFDSSSLINKKVGFEGQNEKKM